MADDGRAPDGPLWFLAEADRAHWHQMPGFLLPVAAERLHRAAVEAPEGPIVEIGTFAGKSLVCLAAGARRGVTVTAIDQQFHEQFADTVARFGLHDLVHPMEMSSLEAADSWRDPIALLYIDAHHGAAHARADFVAWELFVTDGGVIALDDTVGFYPGCTLQVQMALSGGSYELLDDVGGVTFLRKRAPLFPGIGVAPLQRETAFASIAAASAWIGAMDPELRLPNPVRIPLTGALLEERLHRVLADLDAVQRGATEALLAEVGPTVAYLEAIGRLRLGEIDESLRRLDPLLDAGDAALFHYDLEVAPLAQLRRAQVLDIGGRREAAMEAYRQVLAGSPHAALRAVAEAGLHEPFVLPAPAPGRLLREYVLDSPLDGQRRRWAGAPR